MNETSYLLASLANVESLQFLPQEFAIETGILYSCEALRIDRHLQAGDFGTPVSIAAGGWVALREYSRPDGSTCKYDFVSHRV